ncbi:MAG: [Fe-S]-binding protein [Opitutaceae bacterium]
MPQAPMPMPRMYRMRQNLPRPKLADIPAAVRAALAGVRLPIKRGDSVAVGAGSRGIANIALIVRAAVDHLKELGAVPFVFPAMGSHGGATPEGQLEVLEHYGITEQSMGCPLRATMEVVQVGTALGMPVWCDRIASEADWIGVVNRIKAHTDFKGEIESGLFKMLAVGMGKHLGAKQYHRAFVDLRFEKVILAVAREVLANARIGFGLGIVENGHEETAIVEAFNAGDIEAGERRLLKDAKRWMARLPFSPIDVLVVEEIGKNISGSGMDNNVIGRTFHPREPFPKDPEILRVVALDLTDESGGNATGIGNADFTTRLLAGKIDWRKTAINALTASAPNAAMLPLAFDSDREAVESALGSIGSVEPERARVIRIRNTLMLSEIECSEAFLSEIEKSPHLEILGEARPLGFDAAGRIIPLPP